jgi:cytoskeletal protein CcmA (bactofilin family)
MREKEQGGMNLLGKGALFNGEMKVSGSIRIDGEFEGTMEVSETLILGKTGRVKGTVVSKDAVIGGKMDGNIQATERIELQTGSHLSGDIVCRGLVVEDGVFFEGNCRMSAERQSQAPVRRISQETDVQK